MKELVKNNAYAQWNIDLFVVQMERPIQIPALSIVQE